MLMRWCRFCPYASVFLRFLVSYAILSSRLHLVMLSFSNRCLYMHKVIIPSLIIVFLHSSLCPTACSIGLGYLDLYFYLHGVGFVSVFIWYINQMLVDVFPFQASVGRQRTSRLHEKILRLGYSVLKIRHTLRFVLYQQSCTYAVAVTKKNVDAA
ncbi:hypothetical protein L218DRAFT_257539 [Marasmius fiardii PR-910]|nr:hypothetical protein L218DRAFT_257539 [Marasmius fiardii PR-910]